MLSVKVGVSGVRFHQNSPTDTTNMMMVGDSGVFCHLDSIAALYRIINIVATQ